jgi:hypothetical protein
MFDVNFVHVFELLENPFVTNRTVGARGLSPLRRAKIYSVLVEIAEKLYVFHGANYV